MQARDLLVYFMNLYELLHLQRCGSLTKAEFLEPNHTIFGGDIASSIMMMDTLIKLQSAEFGDLTVSFFILFESKNFYEDRKVRGVKANSR